MKLIIKDLAQKKEVELANFAVENFKQNLFNLKKAD